MEGGRCAVNRCVASVLYSLAIACGIGVSGAWAEDWPQWRGPSGNNHAAAEERVPIAWDFASRRNVVWKTKVPGRGHSTPIVVGDAIYLTTAEEAEQTQSLIKFDRETGRLLDRWVVHRGKLPERIHAKNTHASPSPVWDGERIIVVFHQADAIVATALSPSGQQVWQQRVCDFKPSSFEFGYGASPIVVGNVVVVAAEYDGEASGLYGLDITSGRQVWRASRPSNLNFASPIHATIAGNGYVLLAGADTIDGYDARTGKRNWSVPASTEAICGTAVWDGRRVIVSGGNPVAGTWCVTGDGTATLVWENRVMCYEQSLLAIKDYVFAVADNGVAYCWRTQDGREMWRERLFGGGISASPLLVDNKIIVAAENGTMFVLDATPERFKLLQTNPTGDSLFASPVVVDNRILVRTGVNEGDVRQEYLIAIGDR